MPLAPAQGVDVSFKPPTILTPRTSDGCFIVTSWVINYHIRIISALAGNPRIRVLPHPLTPEDRRAGYRYHLSILLFEVSLTQVFDHPLSGRQFFQEAMRDHLDLGRPDGVQLIFGRRVTRRTPGPFRTRVLTTGVDPSLHLDYKRSRIKQCYKQDRALRTETTVKDTHDFGIGRDLSHLSNLRTIGREASRRLLDAQRMS